MAEVNKILTEQEFNTSPLKGKMSYQDYFMNAIKQLKTGSAFTFKKELALKYADGTAERIRNSVKGWALEKEQKKEEAEEKYYAALAQYNLMKHKEEKALKDLKYATNSYGEDSTQYSDALKKYNLSTKTLFNSDINLSCARDQFNFANLSAFKAYLTSRS